MNRRYCLALDLQDDPQLIAEYRRYHEHVWPEITQSIRASGIEDMEIYLLRSHRFMVVVVCERFSLDAKAEADRDNPKVQEWEQLMWKFPRPLPQAKPGEKWILTERIFKLFPK